MEIKQRNFRFYLFNIIFTFAYFDLFELIGSFQISTKCALGEYYDPDLLDCAVCPENMVPTKDGLSCICRSDSYYDYRNITLLYSQVQLGLLKFNSTLCKKCPKGQISNQKRTICMSCPDIIENGECFCPENYYVQETDLLVNVLLPYKQCKECPKGTYPGPTGPVYECKACPYGKIYDKNRNPWECLCDFSSFTTAGDTCIPISESLFLTTNYPVNTAKSVTLNYAETSDPLQDSTISVSSSDTIDYLYLKSGYKCLKESDIQSCNALANICVLQMYDKDNPACKLYKYISDLKKVKSESPDPGWKEGMPWLYYERPADQVINDTQKVEFEVSFDPNDKKNVGRWDIYGKYYGMEPLTNQVTLCSENYEDGERYRSFGALLVQTCSIDLTKYLSRNYTMYFYELFLLEPKTQKLIDIPVMIDNIPNPKSLDAKLSNNGTSPENWILTRRFFIIDNLSALQTVNSFNEGIEEPIAIRFAKLIKMIILLQNTKEPKIMTPYFEILYKAKLTSLLKNFPSVYVKFLSEYKMDIEDFKESMLGIFMALNVLVILMTLTKMYIWYKLNPPDLSPNNYFVWFFANFIIKIFADWGKVMFWYCWAISAYWFIFFKFQYKVFILLPQFDNWKENYAQFDIIYGVACSAYFIYILHRIYRQVNIDIFFIDWEHEKEILVKNATELRPEKYKGAWRLVYVANQFNELQKKRYISFTFSFMWIVFFWWYLDWGGACQSIGGGTEKRSQYSPENYVLRHFVGTFILLSSGVGHLLFNYVFQLCFPLNQQEFIDLCCVSNISVFILDESLHGYYIHGISPAGKADKNLDEILVSLEEEGNGRVKGRGLIEKENDNLQTYEVYISYKMRNVYDGIYGVQTESMILQAETTEKMRNQSRITNFLRALPKTLQIDVLYKLRSYMNSTLKDKIQKISNQPFRYVKEKTSIQRFLNFPPIELVGDSTDDIVLFKGIEWDWFIFDIFVYQMWMLTLNSCAISIFLTFICDKILYTVRAFWGEKNISRKSIIDNKFFMSNSNH